MNSDTTGLQIMLVDDNVDCAQSLAAFLEDAGHAVNVEYESDAALERVSNLPWDICILDIGLPVIDGHMLARHIRALPAMREVMLIAATGYGQPEDIENSLEAGFDYHFVKPIETKKLLALVNYVAMEKSRSAGQLHMHAR